MFEPSLHLHFEISNDCRRCCPRIFRCFCCETEEEQEEYKVKKHKPKLVPVEHADKKIRRKANERLFNRVIPDQLGQDTWQNIRQDVCHLSGVCIEREIEEAQPVTLEKLEKIGKAVDQIIERRGFSQSLLSENDSMTDGV